MSRPLVRRSEPDVKSVSWPQVTLALGSLFVLVSGAVVLASLGKDITIILSLAALLVVPVLSAFGMMVYQKLEQVKEATNGNLSRRDDESAEQVRQMMDLNRQLLGMLAQTHPGIHAEVVEKLVVPSVNPPVSPAPTLPVPVDWSRLDQK